MGEQRLKDRVAIVSGGGRGLGEATSQRYAKEGAIVIVADLDIEPAECVAKEIQDHGGKATAVALDVTSRDAVENVVSSTVSEYGRLDVMATFAGVALFGPALDCTDEVWQRQFDVNVTGTFYCAQIAARQMVKQNSGRIITVSSIMGQRSGDRRMSYGTTKGAVIALTKQMSGEIAPYGVQINSIAPGPIKTKMWLEANTDVEASEAGYLGGIPMGRLGQPEDVANAAFFLASDDCSWITGHVLNVDGGFIATGVRDGIF
jgi:NAD(P)-dependent dehydrogenase (short-subunit alcohol dehydrogenase family)